MYLSHLTTRRILEPTFGITSPAIGFADNIPSSTSRMPTYLALHTSAESLSNLRANTPGATEVAVVGYARQQIPLVGGYRWSDVGINDALRSQISSLQGIQFSKNAAGDNWGTIGWIVAYDAVAAGNILWFTQVNINMQANQVSGITIDAGNLKMRFDNALAPTWGAEMKWRLLRALGRGEYAGLFPMSPGADYTLWSDNLTQPPGGPGYYYFETSPGLVNCRALALHIGTYNDTGTLINSLTADNVTPLFTEFTGTGYNGAAMPSTVPANPSAGGQPILFSFSAAGSGADTHYVTNVNEIRFPVAGAAWNTGASGCLAVVNWRVTNILLPTYVKNRVIAVIPAPNWTLNLGDQLVIPAGGLKLRAD